MQENKMLEIKDAVAVITGGSGGIGKALAKFWVQNGGRAVIADIAEQALKTAAKDKKGPPGASHKPCTKGTAVSRLKGYQEVTIKRCRR